MRLADHQQRHTPLCAVTCTRWGEDSDLPYVITVANPGPCASRTWSSLTHWRPSVTQAGRSGVVFFAHRRLSAIADRVVQLQSGARGRGDAAGRGLADRLPPGRANTLGRQSDTAAVTATGFPALPSNSVTLDVTTTPKARVTRVDAQRVTGIASAGAGGPVAARIARVDVAVRALSAHGRARARGCLWLNGRGRLVRVRPGRSGKCDSPRWLRASGKRRWLYRFRRSLSPGRYQLLVRISNRAGVYDTTFAPEPPQPGAFRNLTAGSNWPHRSHRRQPLWSADAATLARRRRRQRRRERERQTDLLHR